MASRTREQPRGTHEISNNELPKMKNFASAFYPRNVLAGLIAAAILCQFTGCGSVDETQTIADLKAIEVLVSKDVNGRVNSLNNLPTDAENLTKAIDLISKLAGPRTVTILDASELTADYLKTLAGLKDLVQLEFHNAPLDDAAIKPLVGHKKLEALYLINSPITSAAMRDFAKIPKLGLLSLSGTKVDSGYEHLNTLDKFEWLIIGGLTIDDDDAKKISEIPTITHVTMDNTIISPAGVKILKSNAKCTVDGSTIDPATAGAGS